MRRLAMLFAVLATAHVMEVVVTPQRVTAAATVGRQVAGVIRMILNGWRKMPLALTRRQA